MRLSGIASAAVVILSTLGCKPPPLSQVDPMFKKSLHVYFDRLNMDAQLRRDEVRKGLAKSTANPAMLPPAGTIYSTYLFDENAFVVEDFKCRVCATNLLLTIPSQEYLCKSCGHCPYRVHAPSANLKQSPCEMCIDPAGNKPRAPGEQEISKEAFKAGGVDVKPMFEYTQPDTKQPLKALVRYVRRQYVYDARGMVQVSDKAVSRAGSSSSYIPMIEDSTETYARPGYHRAESEYVGTIEFQFKGGELQQISRVVEQPVRGWKDLKGNRQ